MVPTILILQNSEQRCLLCPIRIPLKTRNSQKGPRASKHCSISCVEYQRKCHGQSFSTLCRSSAKLFVRSRLIVNTRKRAMVIETSSTFSGT